MKLQRLLFLQGNRCFFCDRSIPRGQETIEHLVPLSRGGTNSDDNRVVVCKGSNNALGNLPVKEKLGVLLRHRGDLTCPRVDPERASSERLAVASASNPKSSPRSQPDVPRVPAIGSSGALADAVRAHLESMSKARPRRLQPLKNMVASWCRGTPAAGVDEIVALLQASGDVKTQGARLVYPKLEKTDKPNA